MLTFLKALPYLLFIENAYPALIFTVVMSSGQLPILIGHLQCWAWPGVPTLGGKSNTSPLNIP